MARRPRALALPLVLAAACRPAGEEPRPGRPSAREDPRVELLLGACRDPQRYERNSAWIVPVLVEKLAGEPEPARRAQEELALLGDEALEEILRFVRARYADAFQAASLERAMAAAGKNPSPAAREVLFLGLEHPQEVVRAAALQALLAGHLRPEDFDELALRLELPEPPHLRLDLVRAQFASDPERAARLWAGHIEAGRDRGLWREATHAMAEAPALGPELGARLLTLARRAEAPVARGLVVAAARARAEGAGPALAALLDRDQEPTERLHAVQLAGGAGLLEALAPLRGDDDPRVRLAAVAALGAGPAPEEEDPRWAWLAAALDDGSPAVRQVALERLCAWGDGAATDRALAQLDADAGELVIGAMQALRPRALAEPALAERALTQLLARDEAEAHRPLAQRIATLKALGLVPAEGAARRLRAIGLAREGETLQGLRVHEWTAIQAGNTGLPGRAWLAAELGAEDDPLRRIDLLDAVASIADELGRRVLLDALAVPDPSYEALFAAARLVRIGPAELAATRIKRAALDTKDGAVRAALWCVLWRWY